LLNFKNRWAISPAVLGGKSSKFFAEPKTGGQKLGGSGGNDFCPPEKIAAAKKKNQNWLQSMF